MIRSIRLIRTDEFVKKRQSRPVSGVLCAQVSCARLSLISGTCYHAPLSHSTLQLRRAVFSPFPGVVGLLELAARSVLKTLILVVRGFNSKQLNMTANALTYNLVFAIIPILAMVLAIAKGFGFAEIIETHLQQVIPDGFNMMPEVMGMINRYLETAQGGAFIGIGLLILIWAVYSFFRNVEQAFNAIWDVRQSRSIIRQLTTYIAVLFLVPVLIIASTGLTIIVHSTIEAVPLLARMSQWHSALVRLAQFVLVWAVFLWMYMAIPNTKVHLRSALFPALMMGTLFQLLQMLSMYVIVFLGRTSIVYGAFATIPIVMMWLQWTCLLILIGAEMSFAIQNNEQFEYEKDLEKMSRRYKDFLTLYLPSMTFPGWKSHLSTT